MASVSTYLDFKGQISRPSTRNAPFWGAYLGQFFDTFSVQWFANVDHES